MSQDGVLAEVVTDLRALAHYSPDLAEKPIQTLMFSREQYAPDGEDLPTIGERIRSLSSVPEVLAFVHYEGPELLVGSRYSYSPTPASNVDSAGEVPAAEAAKWVRNTDSGMEDNFISSESRPSKEPSPENALYGSETPTRSTGPS